MIFIIKSVLTHIHTLNTNTNTHTHAKKTQKKKQGEELLHWGALKVKNKKIKNQCTRSN